MRRHLVLAGAVLVLEALVLATRVAAAGAPDVYVDAPRRPGAPPTLDHVLLLRADGAMALIETRMRPGSLRTSLKGGYLLSCGSWSAPHPDALSVTYSLLEAYRFKAPAERLNKTIAETLTMSGPEVGMFRSGLSNGAMTLERSRRALLSENQAERLWLACRGAKLPG